MVDTGLALRDSSLGCATVTLFVTAHYILDGPVVALHKQ